MKSLNETHKILNFCKKKEQNKTKLRRKNNGRNMSGSAQGAIP